MAIVVDVAGPLVATLLQVPVWVQQSSKATMSGLFLLFAFFSILPFVKQVKMWLRSPAVWGIWIGLFVLFVILRNIIDQMVIVCFVGMISNIIGAGIYKVGSIVCGKKEKENVLNGENNE